MKTTMKTTSTTTNSRRRHLAVGFASMALATGVAGTAFAATTPPSRGMGQHMSGGPGN